MTSVRISVVLASYNGALYITEQLDSILAALGPEDEIIVSDDGSTDATVERVREIDDPRIRLIAGGERLGYQGNFARAIAAISGEYIFFSDQDDVCLPARIPVSLAMLAHDVCVCGDAIIVDSSLQPIQQSHFAARRARFGAWSLFLRPAVIGATMACRRNFLLSHLPFPEGVPHDMWLSIEAARRGQLGVAREPFILYRRHQTAISATGSLSTRALCKRVRERWQLLRALVELTRR